MHRLHRTRRTTLFHGFQAPAGATEGFRAGGPGPADERALGPGEVAARGEWTRSGIGRTLLLTALLLSPGGLARCQEAAPPAAATPTGTQSAPVGSLPLTVNTPPPDWIKPGLRLTFHTMSGVNRSGDWEFIPDENGGWKDGRGNRYNREAIQSGGSHGYLQANIVSLDGGQAAAQMLFYLFDGMNLAEPLQKIELGYVAPASTCGDLWLHPQALQQLLASGSPGLVISRTSKTIDNATYDGVMIFAKSPHGRAIWIYDLASGVLLYSSQITNTPPKWAQGGAQLSKGGQVVLFTTFKGSRYPTIPWRNEAPPAWLGELQGLDYRGQFCVRQLGVPDTPFPFDVRLEVAERGRDWLLLNASVASHMPGEIPGFGTRASGNHQLCGLWIPPKGLAALQPGQELDSDAMTRVLTRVTNKNGESVTITQTSPRQQLDFTYRLSDGLLVASSFAERLGPVPGMSNVIEFRLTGTR